MRTEFERLRTSHSLVNRLRYRLIRLASVMFSAEHRSRARLWFFKTTGMRPLFCYRPKTWGLAWIQRTPRVIVSLTSYPKRIGSVHRVIATLLSQTCKPDKVILWLGEDKFPKKECELPAELLKLREFGLEICWCHDLRSYTKLVPALQAFPDDIIVTADDDVFYPPEWLEVLYSSYREHPQDIHCHLVSQIAVENSNVCPYNSWQWSLNRGRASFGQLLMGVGGVLYPPHALAKESCCVDAFQRISPTNDDMWFWAMAVLNGTKVRLASAASCKVFVDYTANNSDALVNQNTGSECRSDVDFKTILSSFPLVKSRLFSLFDEKQAR